MNTQPLLVALVVVVLGIGAGLLADRLLDADMGRMAKIIIGLICIVILVVLILRVAGFA